MLILITNTNNHKKDQLLCRHLCSQSVVLKSRKTIAVTPCEKMCFELTRSFDNAGEICPSEKYCRKGCPCQFYHCQKIMNEQTLAPTWDLQNAEISTGKENEIFIVTNK